MHFENEGARIIEQHRYLVSCFMMLVTEKVVFVDGNHVSLQCYSQILLKLADLFEILLGNNCQIHKPKKSKIFQFNCFINYLFIEFPKYLLYLVKEMTRSTER